MLAVDRLLGLSCPWTRAALTSAEVFYLPLHDGIDVVPVLHSARDIESIFEKDQPE
jgi:hypothetical protein